MRKTGQFPDVSICTSTYSSLTKSECFLIAGNCSRDGRLRKPSPSPYFKDLTLPWSTFDDQEVNNTMSTEPSRNTGNRSLWVYRWKRKLQRLLP